MIREKSAGVIVYRENPKDGRQYLLLYHRGSYWNFPKGHVEQGESEWEGARRELREETGLTSVQFIDGFRQQTQFFFKEKRTDKDQLIKKDFILYLAQAPFGVEPRLSHEHNGYGWLDIEAAKKILKFKKLKEILTEADSFIGKTPAVANSAKR